MSITIMAEIWEASPQKGTRLLMLLAIADHANDEGIAWPSQESLAQKCRMSKRQAQNLIKDLVATEELVIEERGTGRGHSTIYRVKPTSTFSKQRVNPATPKGEIQRAKRAKSSSPEPSLTTKEPRARNSKNKPISLKEVLNGFVDRTTTK